MLLTHSDITDAAVIGVSHEEAGEVPRAFVVRRSGSTIGESDVTDFVAKSSAPHKHLVGGVEFVDAIPKSASGKILRRYLRDRKD